MSYFVGDILEQLLSFELQILSVIFCLSQGDVVCRGSYKMCHL